MSQKIQKIIPYGILFVACPIILGLVNVVFPKSPNPGQNPKTPSEKSLPNKLTNSLPVIISKYKSFTEVKIPSGTFKYGGSTTWAPIREIVDSAIQAARPELKLAYINPPAGETPGSSTGIRMLLNNQLDVSVSSRPLNLEEKKQGLIEKEVAFDSIAIAVHPKLELQEVGLTIEQLKGIYTGQITNWQEVGGPNQKITPYTRHPEDGGTVEYFLNDVLEINVEELGVNVETVQDTTSGLRKVGKNLGGIYYASTPEIIRQCTVKTLPLGKTSEKFVPPYKPPLTPPDLCLTYKDRIMVNTSAIRSSEYPITRKLFVVIKQYDQTKWQVGEAYTNLLLTQQGQDLLEKAGFVSVY
ncbi:MAG: substrate-binding domain-containing protein [Scytonema sp. PMC 1069.18]|nr:substrate-binding domain-containing protein [Scytonema sp. PMC 1069.18]MEC4880751.1 substrate-binding domain-containing protein [Scytonema sp. PMC 1070.18]